MRLSAGPFPLVYEVVLRQHFRERTGELTWVETEGDCRFRVVFRPSGTAGLFDVRVQPVGSLPGGESLPEGKAVVGLNRRTPRFVSYEGELSDPQAYILAVALSDCFVEVPDGVVVVGQHVPLPGLDVPAIFREGESYRDRMLVVTDILPEEKRQCVLTLEGVTDQVPWGPSDRQPQVWLMGRRVVRVDGHTGYVLNGTRTVHRDSYWHSEDQTLSRRTTYISTIEVKLLSPEEAASPAAEPQAGAGVP